MIKGIFNIVLKLFLVLCLFSSFYIHGQEKASNNDIWLHYYGKNMITEKFFFHLKLRCDMQTDFLKSNNICLDRQ